ncbi:hypothetical protein EMCG_01663 [[Emmonsia] crescens]|uniref:DUF7587 domain-containing protein n=1 Tax=[Emmonsia] crescens TaxID=73230 RepID=A0A0G2I098_9EURO|nr:hypothetical protein EMCG_01663 [Emmonsia crescens UAMH 3008]
MDKFDLDLSEVPQTLYRVQYEESMTTYDSDTGLKARGNTSMKFYMKKYFGEAVEYHLNWRAVDSVFISLFSDREHAENWMRKMGSKTNLKLLEIDVKRLQQSSYIFKAEEIVNHFNLYIKEIARKSVSKEYLVANGIPSSAIVEVIRATVISPPIPEDFTSDSLEDRLRALKIG